MKVLFVCSDDYPVMGACTSLLKNIFFEGGLAEAIRQVDVLTVKYHIDDLDRVVDRGINVYRVLAWQFIYASEVKKGIAKRPLLSIWGCFQKALIVFVRKVQPANYFNFLTIRAFVKKLKEIKAEQYHAIVAVGGDFHAVEAVRRYIKKKEGPRFIIYQVDPCYSKMTESITTLDSRKNFECQVYDMADVVLTTPILCAEAKNNHCQPYFNKFVSMEFPNVSMRHIYTDYEIDKDKKSITCLFAGSIYLGIRDPRYTLELFRRCACEKLQLILVGVKQEQLPPEYQCNWIHCMGVQSLDETRKLIAGADFLVNIGNIMMNQVPSKLFEYISTGLPIINICKNDNCPTRQYIEKYPYAISLTERPEEVDTNAEKLRRFIFENIGKKANIDEILQIYATCTPKYCATQMLQAINGS